MENSVTFADFISNMGDLVEAAVSWMTSFWTTISSDPILMTVVIGIPLVGLGVGLLTRLIRV